MKNTTKLYLMLLLLIVSSSSSIAMSFQKHDNYSTANITTYTCVDTDRESHGDSNS